MIQWLGDTRYALRTICMLEIWQFGSSMVMFLAALKQVPRSLYEAAEIDGAGKSNPFLPYYIASDISDRFSLI